MFIVDDGKARFCSRRQCRDLESRQARIDRNDAGTKSPSCQDFGEKLYPIAEGQKDALAGFQPETLEACDAQAHFAPEFSWPPTPAA